MSGFLHKIIGKQQAPQSTEEDSDLEKFYTNAKDARQIFKQLITSATLQRRILVIHGLGGVGKSTLLKMCALTCRNYHIPVALVASEEASSPIDILVEWESDLNHDGIPLPTFEKTLNHYRAIQAKVEAKAKKDGEVASQITGTISKTIAKMAITMAASAIPLVGPAVGAVGGESAEAIVNWLRGFLTRPELDIYLDPAERLKSDFLNDLSRVSARQRIVLMADTYEQMAALDDWMRELARKLPKNVLLVIAGRKVPAWDRPWQDWMGRAEIVELKEMTLDDIRMLIHRYYTYIRGGDPDSKQVEAIVQFARGLPMVATTVVQLWVKYGLEDFQMVRPQVVADLVDRLLEGVPEEMRPAFESAAVLRFFNVESLRALLENGNAEILYAELRRWPFIRSRKEGLAVHDTMREMINEAVKMRSPERFQRLHERAAVYYETQIDKAIGDERERWISEQLYHRMYVDEASGVTLFQEIAENFTRYRMINRLSELLNDLNNFPLLRENSQLWREYYSARLMHLGGHYSTAVKVYQRIGENDKLEAKLRAYALCDWGEILCLRENLYRPGGIEKANQILQLSHDLVAAMDVKLAMTWLYLSDVYIARSRWKDALSYLEQPRRFFLDRDDNAGLLIVLFYERIIYRRQGYWQKMFEIEKEMWKIYDKADKPPYLRYQVSFSWDWLLAGTYAEAEDDYRSTLEVVKSLQDKKSLAKKSCDLSLSLSFQGKCGEALIMAEEALTAARSLGSGDKLEEFLALTVYGITCMKCGESDRAEKYFSEAINLGDGIHVYLVATPLFFAYLYEVLEKFNKAEELYQRLRAETKNYVQYYFICGALTGLVRVKYAQNDCGAIPLLWTDAWELAQQYEYNDYFTSLYLTRGHITWDGFITEWESGFESALHYYQLALIHALRFNRFLLDEAMEGGEQGRPLRPIIQHCLARGKEGQRMLAALRDWWQTGTNDIGTPRPDTISPIPESIPLMEAEKIARQREPGDGSAQIAVIERINRALGIEE